MCLRTYVQKKSSYCPLRPHTTSFPEEKSIPGVIYGVLLFADMNAVTPLGAWGRSVISFNVPLRRAGMSTMMGMGGGQKIADMALEPCCNHRHACYQICGMVSKQPHHPLPRGSHTATQLGHPRPARLTHARTVSVHVYTRVNVCKRVQTPCVPTPPHRTPATLTGYVRQQGKHLCEIADVEYASVIS